MYHCYQERSDKVHLLSYDVREWLKPVNKLTAVGQRKEIHRKGELIRNPKTTVEVEHVKSREPFQGSGSHILCDPMHCSSIPGSSPNLAEPCSAPGEEDFKKTITDVRFVAAGRCVKLMPLIHIVQKTAHFLIVIISLINLCSSSQKLLK